MKLSSRLSTDQPYSQLLVIEQAVSEPDKKTKHTQTQLPLFTGELAVETAECNAERLDSTQWIVVVHRKDIFRDTAKLHYDVFDCQQRAHHVCY